MTTNRQFALSIDFTNPPIGTFDPYVLSNAGPVGTLINAGFTPNTTPTTNLIVSDTSITTQTTTVDPYGILSQTVDFPAPDQITPLYNAYGLPVEPSLNVVNVAKVGQLTLGELYAPPPTLRGLPTDKAGMFRAGTTGLYYCTSDYTNGATDIWKFAPYEGGAGYKFRNTPVNNYPYGAVGDKAGDIVVIKDTNAMFLVCFADYTDGSIVIWKTITTPSNDGIFQFQETIFTDGGGFVVSGNTTLRDMVVRSVISGTTFSINEASRGKTLQFVNVAGASFPISLGTNHGIEVGWYCHLENRSGSNVTFQADLGTSLNDVGQGSYSLPVGGHVKLYLGLNDNWYTTGRSTQ